MSHTKFVMETIERSVFNKVMSVVDFILVCVTKIEILGASYDYKTSFDYLDHHFNLAWVWALCCLLL